MKNLAKFLLLPIFTLFALLLFIWFVPGTFLNSRTAKLVLSKQSLIFFEPKVPDDFTLKVRNHFLDQKIEISSSAFCMRTKDDSFKVCFDQFEVQVLGGLTFKLITRFKEVGPINIIAHSLLVDSSKSGTAGKKEQPDNKPFHWPKLSEHLKLNPVHITLKNGELRSKRSSQKLEAAIIADHGNENEQFKILMNGKLTSTTDPKNIVANYTAVMDSKYDVEGKLTASVFSAGKKPRIDANVVGNLNLIDLRGQVTGSAKFFRLVEMLPLIELSEFTFKSDQELSISGKVKANLAVGTIGEPKKSALPPIKLNTQLNADLVAQRNADGDIKFSLALAPLENYGLTLESKVEGEYLPKKSDLVFKEIYIKGDVPQFQKSVKLLHKTQYAVPAPFSDLAGEVHFKVGNKETLHLKNEVEVPIQLNTKLHSSKQAFDTDVKGKLNLELNPFKGKLTLDVLLEKISLELPDLDPIVPMPSLKMDSRIVQNEQKESPLALDIKIKTAGQPVKIFHKLFAPEVAFKIATHVISPGESTYQLNFEPFTITYLKRTAELERLSVRNGQEQHVALVGRIVIKKTDYLLYANISTMGTKTAITLTSDPPLPESDIISLILFNQLSTDLDSSGSDSVQDTHAALQNRALGFFSFWVLSTTPVESVGYNPATQVYSARVRVANGLSATVGTDWDQSREVGLRKRLGGKWVVSAGVVTEQGEESRQESMIEWYNRY